MTLSGAPRLNSYGIHFPVDWNGRSVLVVVPHEALHKAEANILLDVVSRLAAQ